MSLRSHDAVPPIVIAMLVAIVATALILLAACTWYVYRSVAPVRRHRMLGVLLILLVVFLWTASSVAVQLVFEAARYRKPFFLTYLSTSLLVVYLPFYPRRIARLASMCIASFRGARTGAGPVERRQVKGRGHYDLLAAGKTDSALVALDSATSLDDVAASELAIATRLCIIFFSYQLCYNVGLELSTVSMVTVISTTSGFWTLLFSALRLRERVGVVKLLFTLLTFGGVLLVVTAAEAGGGNDSGHDHGSNDLLKGLISPHRMLLEAGSHGRRHGSPTWGNGATLLSALLYGTYAVQLKRDVPSEEAVPMPYLFGLLGLMTILIFTPCIAIFHMLKLESFSPPSQATLVALVLNGLLGSVLSNMLLARAMLLASPLVATVGLSLSIPLAMGADTLRDRGHFGQNVVLGTVLVWMGFVGVSGAEYLEKVIRCRRFGQVAATAAVQPQRAERTSS